MEKLSREEVVERFGDATSIKYFRKHKHISELDIRYRIIKSMFQYYEEVEKGGYGDHTHYILRKKRLKPIRDHEVSSELVFQVAKTRSRNYPLEFYRNDVGFVYLITNKYTSEIYVGSTKRALNKRINKHKSDFSRPTSLNYKTKISVAFRLHGFDAFEWKILQILKDEKMLKVVENEWIEKLDAILKGYNENKSYRKKTRIILTNETHNMSIIKEK